MTRNQRPVFAYVAAATLVALLGGDQLLAGGSMEMCPSSCPDITLAPPSLPGATAGVAYQEALGASGGRAPYTFVMTGGSLPPGLSLDPAGILSGTPTASGTYVFGVNAVDACGCTGSFSYALQVCRYTCPEIAIEPTSLPDAVAGSIYSQLLTASGGDPAYELRVSSGSLPPGVALFRTGLVYGVPAATGSFAFTAEATDACSCAGKQSYVLVVTCAAPVAISPATLPAGELGVPYSTTLAASGGKAPYVFSSTTPPSGLSLSSAGVLSGTPLAAGSFPMDVTATDVWGCAGARSYVVEIAAIADVVAGLGQGQPNANRVRLFDQSATPAPVDFLAYGAGQWGLNVVTGELDGSVHAEILTGPGPGPVFGPQVRGFSRAGAPMGKVNYYAYGTLRHGVDVAAGSLDADPYAEILSGAGPGSVFAPHVRGWNFDGQELAPIGNVSFFAFGTLQYGVNVGTGDLDADGFAEVLAGPGPGPSFGATVRGFDVDGGPASPMGKVNFAAFPLGHGSHVAGGDVDGDGLGEIVAAPGAGSSNEAWFRGFRFDGVKVAALPGFDAKPFPTSYGGRVGLGDLDRDGVGELVAGAGPDPGAPAEVLLLEYEGGALLPLPLTPFQAFPGSFHGLDATVGSLGY